MKLFIWQNKESGGYTVTQKQRYPDGSYETVTVGSGNTFTAPGGEPYIQIKVDGFSDNAPAIKELAKTT